MKAARFLAVLAIALAQTALLWAQNNPNTDQGMKPYDSFHGGALDSVSVTSGNLFFHHTEYSVPQRGHVGLTFSLQYNNKGFRLRIVCVNGTKGPWQMPPASANPPSSGSLGCAAHYIWHLSGGSTQVFTGVQLISDQTLRIIQQN